MTGDHQHVFPPLLLGVSSIHPLLYRLIETGVRPSCVVGMRSQKQSCSLHHVSRPCVLTSHQMLGVTGNTFTALSGS